MINHSNIISLYNTSVDPSNFIRLETDDLPLIVLGSFINNQYDFDRVQFKKSIKHINICHACGVDKIYIKGVILTPNDAGCSFLTEVNTFPNSSTFEKYNLTSNNNYIYNRNGLYVIDLDCINTITDYNLDSNILAINDDLPWFSNFIDLKAFCLTSIV